MAQRKKSLRANKKRHSTSKLKTQTKQLERKERNCRQRTKPSMDEATDQNRRRKTAYKKNAGRRKVPSRKISKTRAKNKKIPPTGTVTYPKKANTKNKMQLHAIRGNTKKRTPNSSHRKKKDNANPIYRAVEREKNCSTRHIEEIKN